MNASFRFQLKMRMQRAVLACPVTLRREKVVMVALLDHLNTKTGRCFPTRKRLAETTGFGVRTISRALVGLEEAGWITRRLTRGAPWYYFPLERLQEAAPPVAPHNSDEDKDGVTVLSSRGATTVPQGVPVVAHGIENELIKEIEKYGSDEPSPASAGSSSPEMGFQEENGLKVVVNNDGRAEIDRQWWKDRYHENQKKLETCTDPQHRAELEAKSARYAAKLERRAG